MSLTTPSKPLLQGLIPPASTFSNITEKYAFVRDRRIKYILKKIHTDLAQPHQVKKLAQEVKLSPDYLERVFQAEMGQGLTQYIQQARLLAASDLLVTSFMRIAEIAKRVGFRSASYFTEVFHTNYGLTPTAYRQQFEYGAVKKFRIGDVKEMTEMCE